MISPDMRTSARVPVTQLVVGLPDGDRYVEGNISSGGVGFSVDDVSGLVPGQAVAVRVLIPESHEPLAMAATVCHVHWREADGRFYVGAVFGTVDELVSHPLFRFIEETALSDRAF